jgi:tyrosyl-DNA phosphodiesterase 2
MGNQTSDMQGPGVKLIDQVDVEIRNNGREDRDGIWAFDHAKKVWRVALHGERLSRDSKEQLESSSSSSTSVSASFSSLSSFSSVSSTSHSTTGVESEREEAKDEKEEKEEKKEEEEEEEEEQKNGNEQIRMVTYNVWFDGLAQAERNVALLNLIEREQADIVCLQEVTDPLIERLKRSKFIQRTYAVHDLDRSTFNNWYGTAILISRSRFERTLAAGVLPLPSDQGRQFCYVDVAVRGVASPSGGGGDDDGKVLRVGTIHLESKNSPDKRREQLDLIFPALCERAHSVFMGDMNQHDGWEHEEASFLKRAQSHVDAWRHLHPDEPGYSENSDVNSMLKAKERKDKFVRFDRVFVGSQRWRPTECRLLGTKPITDIEGPYQVFISDHFGLFCSIDTH